MPLGPGPWVKLRGGSLDGQLRKLTRPDVTVESFYFSRNNLQWTETYTLLAGAFDTNDENSDLVWPVMALTEWGYKNNGAAGPVRSI